MQLFLGSATLFQCRNQHTADFCRGHRIRHQLLHKTIFCIAGRKALQDLHGSFCICAVLFHQPVRRILRQFQYQLWHGISGASIVPPQELQHALRLNSVYDVRSSPTLVGRAEFCPAVHVPAQRSPLRPIGQQQRYLLLVFNVNVQQSGSLKQFLQKCRVPCLDFLEFSCACKQIFGFDFFCH